MNYRHFDLIYADDPYRIIYTPNTRKVYKYTLIKNFDTMLQSSGSLEELKTTLSKIKLSESTKTESL